MKMYYETSVITRLSRRVFMDSLFFFHLIFFFVQFKTFNIWKNKKKNKKKNVFRGRNTSEIKKEKLLNKQSKLVSAADILDWKEFQIKNISSQNLLDLRR